MSITYFPEEETEAQRGEIICFQSHREPVSKLGLERMSPTTPLGPQGALPGIQKGHLSRLFPRETKMLPRETERWLLCSSMKEAVVG